METLLTYKFNDKQKCGTTPILIEYMKEETYHWLETRLKLGYVDKEICDS